MKIQVVKETIISWVKSCNRMEQLDGLEKSSQQIIDTLFDKTETPLTIELAKASITTWIEIQKSVIEEKSIDPNAHLEFFKTSKTELKSKDESKQ